MLQGIRSFVHLADSLLNADLTRDRCDAMYDAMREDSLRKTKKAEERKEILTSYKDLFISLAPTLLSLFTELAGGSKETKVSFEDPMQIGRSCCPPAGIPHYRGYPIPGEMPMPRERPVVVDREEQGNCKPPAQPTPEGAAPKTSFSNVDPLAVEMGFRAISRTLTMLSTRVSNLENAVKALESQPLTPETVAAEPPPAGVQTPPPQPVPQIDTADTPV